MYRGPKKYDSLVAGTQSQKSPSLSPTLPVPFPLYPGVVRPSLPLYSAPPTPSLPSLLEHGTPSEPARHTPLAPAATRRPAPRSDEGDRVAGLRAPRSGEGEPGEE